MSSGIGGGIRAIRFEAGRDYLQDADAEYNEAEWRWRCVSRTDGFVTVERTGRPETRRRLKVRVWQGSEWAYQRNGCLSLFASRPAGRGAA